ncbi:BMT4 [Candida metapsilosis]|uniref:BMT4 n=1 Tax=Candida metapsilosis TaxID=273372 RepID=A0A8H7Z9E2_9ASCO|nr:BMT4 [Candida metapsilosis]
MSGLRQQGQMFDKSMLYKELLKMKFDTVVVAGFSFDDRYQPLSGILPQDSKSGTENNSPSDPKPDQQSEDQKEQQEQQEHQEQSKEQSEQSKGDSNVQSEKKDDRQSRHRSRSTSGSNLVDGSFDCSSILIRDQANIAASEAFDLNRESDLKHLRDQLQVLSKENEAYRLCFQDDSDQSEEYVLRRKWFKFCGSAVWMDLYKVYFMVNRIVYAKDARRSHPTISVLSGQVFDKHWREIKGFKFPHSDLTFPTILPHDLDLGTKEDKSVIGSEDPRIILNEYKNADGARVQEPVIIFNARRTKVNWARAMNVYRPFNDPHEIICLTIKDKKRSFIEKNWAPFIDNSNINNEQKMINFIYNFNPLRTVKCSLESGECVKVSGPNFNPIDANDNAGVLRGGTNLVEIPKELLPSTEVTRNRKFWLGIARSHNKECGCMHELYRPHLFIMARSLTSEDSLELVYVSSMVDFNINPEPWSKRYSSKGTCKDGKSVLIPNSIAYWDVNPRDGTDYMGVTFSEADRTNKLIHIRGILKHIHKVLHVSGNKEGQDANAEKEALVERDADHKMEDVEWRNRLLGFCSTYLAGEYCEVAEKTFGWIEA